MLLNFLVRPRTSSPFRKRAKRLLAVKPENYEALDKALKKWLLNLHSENVVVNGSLLKEKALEFASEVNIEVFQASDR